MKTPSSPPGEIGRQLGVTPAFDARLEAERRVEFLRQYLAGSGLQTLVLGISGGVDSTVAGRLAQLAVERLRAEGKPATFIAMRLPYGEQLDERDAQQALAFIKPDEVLTVNIKAASDAALASLVDADVSFPDEAAQDFNLGNIKARQRMVAQYAVAGSRAGLVIGTDQAAEALMGFFTKHGDGACDLVPLEGLTKRRVRALAAALGAPNTLINKVPTADLETLSPLKPDEASYGVSYQQIDDYLEGLPVDANATDIIESTYRRSAHKRALPPGP